MAKEIVYVVMDENGEKAITGTQQEAEEYRKKYCPNAIIEVREYYDKVV